MLIVVGSTELEGRRMLRKLTPKKTKRGTTGSKHGVKSRSNGAARKQEPKVDLDRPPAAIRGLMPTPPEVAAMMEEMFRDLPISEGFRRIQTDYLCQKYYFGGNPIAFRDTPKGREILAVGWDEIAELEKKPMSRKERRTVVHGFAEPW
jgi:hypothetical protein